jgi:hypothetical protein
LIDGMVLSRIMDIETALKKIEAHLNRIDEKLNQIHNDMRPPAV